jgi:predicted RNA-binding Zn ribbon-like protein
MTFEFIADRPALDFVATVAERGTTDLDALQSPDDLAAWVRQSGLVTSLEPVTADDLRQARSVREALFALIAALVDDATVPRAARALVNATAAEPGPRVELGPRGAVSRSGAVAAMLSVLAADVIDLHDSPDRELLHWCADRDCTRPFIDRSRGHRRRWCGMRGCGDRAKAAAYRQRQRAAGT